MARSAHELAQFASLLNGITVVAAVRVSNGLTEPVPCTEHLSRCATRMTLFNLDIVPVRGVLTLSPAEGGLQMSEVTQRGLSSSPKDTDVPRTGARTEPRQGDRGAQITDRMPHCSRLSTQ